MSVELRQVNPGLWRAYQVAFALTVGAGALIGIVWLLGLAGMDGLGGVQSILLPLVMIGGVCMGVTYGILALQARR